MSAGPLPNPLECPEAPASTLGAIVVAAGSSTRMGGIDKAFTPLLGMPLIAHCLDQLESFPPITRITLVLSQQSLGLGEELVASRKYTKVSSVCAGGARRQDSVRLGLESLGSCDWVLGMPLIAHCLDQLESFPPITRITLVLSQQSLGLGEELVASRKYTKVSSVCAGGARRQDSVRLGLESLGSCDWVLVHDGARPCLDHSLLERGWDAVRRFGAAVAGVPVKDTIKVVSAEQAVIETPPREGLWAAQTPQFFRYELLQQAHQEFRDPGREPVTDDAAMVEQLGHPVQMFLGSYENLKITTPVDLTIAEALLASRYSAQPTR